MANVLNVNPNRMELLKLSRRMSLAKRGHRLLKDKQDELMERFTETGNRVRQLRKKIEQSYSQLKTAYVISRYISDSKAFRYYCENPVVKVRVEGKHERLMNLNIPVVNVDFEDEIERLGNLNLSSVFPSFLKDFQEVVKEIAELANAEKKMFMLAEELEKVRRRVNALEHIFIPKIEETIEYISMQLEEMERENITMLMKIKDIVRKTR